MGLKERMQLYATSLVIAAAIYGNARFHANRYKPQPEHLPGISIVSKEKPTRFDITSENDSLVTPSLVPLNARICFDDSCDNIKVNYSPKSRIPQLEIRPNDESPKGNAIWQVVIEPHITIDVKGSSGRFGTFTAAIFRSFLGFGEIAGDRYPLSIPCQIEDVPMSAKCSAYCSRERRGDVGNENKKLGGKRAKKGKKVVLEAPPDPFVKDLCETEEKLIEIENAGKGFEPCWAHAARSGLSKSIDENELGLDVQSELINSKNMIELIESPPAVASGKPFWRGWDWVAGLFAIGIPAFIEAVLLFGRKRTERKKKEAIRMENEKEQEKREFEETKERFKKRIQEFKKKFNDVQTREEFEKLSREDLAAAKEMTAENKSAYYQLEPYYLSLESARNRAWKRLTGFECNDRV